MARKRRRWLSFVGILALVVPLLAACGGGAPTAQPSAGQQPSAGTAPSAPGKPGAPRGGVLRTVYTEPTTLDPHLTQDQFSSEYVVEIFSGLVAINPKLQVVPDLAEKWELSQDGRTYRFTLMSNAKFHDGKAVKASDVKYSIERAADPRTRSVVADTYLGDIVGVQDKLAGKANEVQGVKVIDDQTVEITIDQPKIYFLAKLTYPTAFVVDKQNVESSRNWTDKPNGTGPFKLKEFRRDSRVVLSRNENFYRTPALLDEVQFDIGGGSAMTKYENGEIDVHPGVSVTDIDRVLDRNGPLWPDLVKDANGNPGITELSVGYVGVNTTMPPFDDLKVRQAFNHAVDKKLLNESVAKNMLTVADGILPPGLPGFNPNLKGLTYDPALAKKLLSESKYASNMPRIKLSFQGTGGTPTGYIPALVDQWKRNLGVEVELEQVEWATYLQDLKARKYQMFEIGWIADYPDPQDFLDVLFHSKSLDNNTGYANPEVDRPLEQARVERDVEKRLKLYQQAEQTIVTDAPWIPLNYGKQYPLVKPNVKGLEFTPLPAPRYQYAYLEKK